MTYQDKVVKYNEQLEDIERNIVLDIEAIMEGKERVEVDDLYVGEWQATLSGYPTVEAIENRDGEIIIINDEPDNEERTLDGYHVGELLAILNHIQIAINEA